MTSAASVASDASNDAFLTKASGATTKVAVDGSLLWTKPFGSLVAVSANGDIVIAGTFSGTLALDATTLVAAGGTDVFVAVLDADGSVQQSRALGGAGDETVTSLAVDANGRAFVSGAGLGTVALDRGGAVAWQKTFVAELATDASGDLLLTGGFSGSVDFGGGSLTSAGGKDVFVAKLDRDGNHLLSRAFGDAGAHQEGQAISADLEGNILVAGTFDGSIDFGGGALHLGSCPAEAWCNTWGFVAKLAPDGSPLWSLARGPLRDVASIRATSTESVLVSGAEPGDAEPYRTPLLMAFDSEGQKLWERREWPETGLGAGRGLAVDACDNALWSVSARPSLDAAERAYLAKITP